VNFPTLPGFGGRKFVSFHDEELALAGVQAWNDFLLDEWPPSASSTASAMSRWPS
jgi:hypothetical protein